MDTTLKFLPQGEGGRTPLSYMLEHGGSMDLPDGFMFDTNAIRLATTGHSSGFGPSIGTHNFTYKVRDSSETPQELEKRF